VYTSYFLKAKNKWFSLFVISRFRWTDYNKNDSICFNMILYDWSYFIEPCLWTGWVFLLFRLWIWY